MFDTLSVRTVFDELQDGVLVIDVFGGGNTSIQAPGTCSA